MARAHDAAAVRTLAAHRRATLWVVLLAMPLAVIATSRLELYGTYPKPSVTFAMVMALPLGVAGRAAAWLLQRLWLGWFLRRRTRRGPRRGEWATVLVMLAVLDVVACIVLAVPSLSIAVQKFFTHALGAFTLYFMPAYLVVGPAVARALRPEWPAEADAEGAPDLRHRAG